MGLDRAIVYSLVGQGWTVLAGPLTLFFVAGFLSPEEQGFYYTFASILGLQIFLELGLSYVLLQFASHEKASLHWTPLGTLEGDARAKARLWSLLRRALIWYGVMSILVLSAMIPAGLYFFGQQQGSAAALISWRGAWLWVALVAAGNLALTPIFAVLEGCGLIAEIALLRLWRNVATSLASWLMLSQGWKLLAVPGFHTVTLAYGALWLALRQRRFLLDLAASGADKSAASIDWWREVWPFQWKIALNGVSSYFVFSFFNPVLFAFQGAVAAGQMGMSNAVLTALAHGAGAWMGTKIASFGALAAQKEWKALDRLFFPTLWRSLALLVLSSAALLGAACFFYYVDDPWSRRILPPLPLALFIGATLCSHVAGAQAMYLRAHKQEPFLVLSVASGCAVGLSTYVLGKAAGALGMMAGYFVLSLLNLGASTWIFQSKRLLWHRDAAQASADAPPPQVL